MHRWDGGNLMDKLQAFYKSKKWEAFVKQLRIDRASADGFVICAHCGKPIVKAYDCIAHHKQELTLLNVDDSMVSLNPDNIIFVHFRCHNEIHKRFGFGGKCVSWCWHKVSCRASVKRSDSQVYGDNGRVEKDNAFRRLE